MKRRITIFASGLSVFAVVLALALFAGSVPAAHAATINVTASAADVLNGANASCSLREAITNINNAASTYADCAPASGAYGTSDTINLPAGTYTNAIATTHEDANANGDLDILSSVAIVGAGAATTIIDGGGIDRVLHINPAWAVGVVVSISGVTITGGNPGLEGGGIFHNFGSLIITNSTISRNTATSGGGGSTTVEGGGIFSNGSSLTITNSTISGNTATTGGGGSSTVEGGGIFNNGSTLTITNSTISSNTATTGGGGSSTVYGGGISNNGGTLTITNSTFSGNSSTQYGGGIRNSPGTVTITNSTFSGNSATMGGGISSSVGGTVTITNSTFSGNSASAINPNPGGGGIANATTTITITNSTFSGNSASSSYGGGIYNYLATATLRNTIVANNTASTGNNCSGSVITNGGNNIEYGITCGWGSTSGSMSSTNPLLGPLASNGGPTQTMALLAGSPAIDGVTFSPPNSAPVTDQRGISRPQGVRYDIGAYEYVAPTTAVSVPTMTEWGMIVFLLLAGLGSIYYMRRRSRTDS